MAAVLRRCCHRRGRGRRARHHVRGRACRCSSRRARRGRHRCVLRRVPAGLRGE
jgi:hypothetical protein